MNNSVKNIILYIISIAIVAVIVMLIVTETEQMPANGDKVSTVYLDLIIGDETEESSEDEIYIVTSMAESTTEEEITTSKYWDIEVLITSYFEAIRTCNVEGLKSIVDSNEKVSEEILNQKAQYIEAYTNFSYYLKSGMVDNTYIVYVVYDIKLKEIEVPVPALERFYIKKNSDGVVYISRLPLEGTVAEYLKRIEEQEVVIQLVTSVEERYEQACSSEERLLKLEDIIKTSVWESK